MQRLRRTVGQDAEMDSMSVESVGSPPTSAALRLGLNGDVNCILHPVCRFDTLPGVAIRYGVEVSDIKRLNGLSSDLQMFALKTLQIPSPGRHPPSPNGHNTTEWPNSAEHQTPPKRRQSDIFNSFPSLKSASYLEREVSPAMSSLQDYYGTTKEDKRATPEGLEMAMYQDRATQGGLISSSSPLPNPPLSHHRKSKSVANSLMSANGSLHDPLLSREGECSASTDEWIEKLLRRRQKSESDFSSYPSEKLLEEGISNGTIISTITCKGLALRPKSSSRGASGVDAELVVPIPIPLGDASAADTVNSVRKSSSTSSLQDAENGPFSSLWQSSKWSLKPDFQALSSAAIPIFDGFPKAIGKKNKAAMD